MELRFNTRWAGSIPGWGGGRIGNLRNGAKPFSTVIKIQN